MRSHPLCNESGNAANSILTALHDLSETAPAVAKAIFSNDNLHPAALRATNRLLRLTLNRTVEELVLGLGSWQQCPAASVLDNPSDLGVTFPNATKLVLDLRMEPSRAALASFLTHSANYSPRLISRLQKVVLHLHDGHGQGLCLTVLTSFLSRCSRLEDLSIRLFTADVNGDTLALGFQGQGGAPSDRVASMQAQLAAFCTTPNFLHSASWPHLPCLTSLDLSFPISADSSALEAIFSSPLHVFQATSLRSLEVDFGTLPAALPKEHRHLVSTLVRLTSLSASVSDSSGEPIDCFWSHVTSLSSLQQLRVFDGSGQPFTIPRCWRHLLQVTSLAANPRNTTLANPAGLRLLTGLQELSLRCSTAELCHLCLLDRLTSLSVRCVDPDVPGLPAPQQQQQPPQQQQLPAAAAAAGALGGAQGGPAAAAAAAGSAWACCSTLVALDWQVGLASAPLQHLTRLTRLRLDGDSDHAVALPDMLLAALAGVALLEELELDAVQISAELLWALGQLPKLSTLTLHDTPTQPFPPVAHPYLPTLSIRTLRLIDGAHWDQWASILTLLLASCRLPASATATPITIRTPTQPTRPDVHCRPSQCADSAWLASLLSPDNDVVPLRFTATCDRDLQLLSRHLGAYKHSLWLTLQGASFAPDLLGAALAAYGGKRANIYVLDPRPHTGLGDLSDLPAEHITDEHIRAMLPALSRLVSLEISDCPLVSDAAVAEVAAAMGDRLTQLTLRGARRLSDTTMWALTRHCRKLRKLEIAGATEVTNAGALPLLRFVPAGGLWAMFEETGVNWNTLRGGLERRGVDADVSVRYLGEGTVVACVGRRLEDGLPSSMD